MPAVTLWQRSGIRAPGGILFLPDRCTKTRQPCGIKIRTSCFVENCNKSNQDFSFVFIYGSVLMSVFRGVSIGQVTGDYGGHADEEKDALCQVKGADVSMMLLERELTQFPD